MQYNVELRWFPLNLLTNSKEFEEMKVLINSFCKLNKLD